ncbi:glycosyltransferase [Aliidiomarina sp. Khilg15.8]
MKILLITSMFPSSKDPLKGIFVKRFVDSLSERGVQFEVVALDSAPGITKTRKLAAYLKYFLRAIKALWRFDGDFVYVHYLSYNLLPFLLFPKLSKPLVLNAHGSDVVPVSRFASMVQNVVTPVLSRAQLVVVPSTYFAGKVQQKYPVRDANLFVSPSAGVNTDEFKPALKSEAPPRSDLVVGFVSRVEAGKGWEVLLDAIKYIVADEEIPIKCKMYGSGLDTKALKQQINEHELNDVVEFMGYAEPEQLPEIMRGFDVFVFPTKRQESLGLVGVEALASGVPVIASEIGAIPEFVQEAYNGFLFEMGNAKALAGKIQAFHRLSGPQRSVMQEQARRTGIEFSGKQVASRMLNKLQELSSN